MNISKGTNWRIYWGAMPLPNGAEALGTVTRDTGTGALIKLESGAYVQGNAGSIRILPQNEVEQALARAITPHKGGRDVRGPSLRMTELERQRLDEILARRGLSFADWVAEQIEREK